MAVIAQSMTGETNKQRTRRPRQLSYDTNTDTNTNTRTYLSRPKQFHSAGASPDHHHVPTARPGVYELYPHPLGTYR